MKTRVFLSADKAEDIRKGEEIFHLSCKEKKDNSGFISEFGRDFLVAFCDEKVLDVFKKNLQEAGDSWRLDIEKSNPAASGFAITRKAEGRNRVLQLWSEVSFGQEFERGEREVLAFPETIKSLSTLLEIAVWAGKLQTRVQELYGRVTTPYSGWSTNEGTISLYWEGHWTQNRKFLISLSGDGEEILTLFWWDTGTGFSSRFLQLPGMVTEKPEEWEIDLSPGTEWELRSLIK